MLQTITTTDPQPSFFFDAEWFPSEVELFSEREDLSTAEWAEKYRYVVKSSKPGPWRNENNPPLKGVMDLIDFARKSVAIRKGVQTGGSEAAYNYLLRKMDTSPHNALLVMETERKTARVVKQRVRPMLEATPKVAEKFSDNPDHLTNYSIMLRTGFTLNIGWSTSQAANSSDPVETAVFDEVDKYETAMNLEEGKDRVTTYKRTGKIIFLSTPGLENGPISQEIESCEVVYDFQACCPDCGVMQVMKFENFTWPMKDVAQATDAERKKLANIIERDRLARYRCEGCGGEWDDYTRNKAVELGTWEPRHAVHERPISIGIEYPSWISPFKSLSEVAARWIRAQGNQEKVRAWYNQEAAEPFVESQQGDSLQEDDLYKRRYRFAPEGASWQVPMGACVLTAFADIQANRVECAVMGWGPGFESWVIERVILPGDFAQDQVKADLDRYLQKEWLHESGAKLKIVTAGVDSGYLAPEVYRFVRPRQLGRRVYATKGSSTVGKALISVTDPKKKKGKDRHKVTLINIGTETAKDTLFARFQIEAPGPGYVHFSDALDYDFFKQLTAEQCITRYKSGRPFRVWEKKRSDARNEALDLAVGNLAVVELLNPNFEAIKKQVEVKVEVEEKPKPEPVKKERVVPRQKGFVNKWRR